MNPGRLRHRIIIQSLTETVGNYGGVDTIWATAKIVWARITPLAAEELVYHDKLGMRATHKVFIRYYSAIQPNWRILYGTRIFKIQSIRNIEELNKEQVLLCEEIV